MVSIFSIGVSYRWGVFVLLGVVGCLGPSVGGGFLGCDWILTNQTVNSMIRGVTDLTVADLGVIDEPSVAAALLDPIRARVLSELSEPGSATTVATALGETRQKINYHLRALEHLGLVRFVEERPRRGLTERVVVASARAYVLSPDVLGERAVEPERTDRLSSNYVIALAARVIREVADLARRAEAADRPLATLAIDTDIRFATADDRAEFTRELTEAVADLAARYHDEQAGGGRWHRVVALAHQHPPTRQSATTRKAAP